MELLLGLTSFFFPWPPATPKLCRAQVKEPWELFLDKKKQDYVTQQRGLLRRTRDGTYTSESAPPAMQPRSACL